MMPNAEQYRQNLAECLKLAAIIHDREDKGLLLAMAEGWRVLAERADQTERDSVLDTPPPERGRSRTH
jgi:hypothetical protein